MIKAGYYARVDYTILKEFLSIQRPLNQHVTGNYKRVLSFVLCPRYFVTRIIIVLFLYSFSRGFCSIVEQRWNFFRFFFSLQIENIFRYPLLLYASTVLITRSFNFLLARIKNDLYYYQFSKISFNYLLSNKLFLKKSYFLIQF